VAHRNLNVGYNMYEGPHLTPLPPANIHTGGIGKRLAQHRQHVGEAWNLLEASQIKPTKDLASKSACDHRECQDWYGEHLIRHFPPQAECTYLRPTPSSLNYAQCLKFAADSHADVISHLAVWIFTSSSKAVLQVG